MDKRQETDLWVRITWREGLNLWPNEGAIIAKNELQHGLSQDDQIVEHRIVPMDDVRRALWKFVANQNYDSYDAGQELAQLLNELGLPCPEDMDDQP